MKTSLKNLTIVAALVTSILASCVAFATETIKTLGQLNPSATTATDLYTAPISTSAVISTLTITNQSSSAGSFRVSVRVAGAAANAKQYLAYDVPIPGNDTIIMTLGITLATTDVITVYSSSANISFNLFGSEIS